MGERRPGRRHPGALGLGCGRLRLGAADGSDAAFAARNALRRLVQIADRALAADRAVIEMRRLDAEAIGKKLFRIAVAPAQEVDDVERADIAEQLSARVSLRTLERFFKQGEGLKPGGDILGTVDDFADADDDGDAVFRNCGHCSCSSLFFFFGAMDCFAALAMTENYSATSAFMCSTASINSSLNSCTTALADFTLSIRPTPWPTK